jgi:transposase-like protein
MEKIVHEKEEILSQAIKIDGNEVKRHLDEMVRESVEDTLNSLLDAEADELCKAKRYERTAERADTRAGSYQRKLHTKAGEVKLKVPKLRSLPFETQIIERYRRLETSVEEALIEMYLAGVSVRRVEDKYPYVYMDGICLKRSWGGEYKNVSVLVAIGVNADRYREILGVREGMKEDKEGWTKFLRHLKNRGLKGVKLIISDKCLGLVESVEEHFPDAKWQRCVVHWHRNVFTQVHAGKRKEVAARLRHISGTKWGQRKYINMERLAELEKEQTAAA